MSWVGLKDTPEGIQVTVNDAPGIDGDFVEHDVALLKHEVPHAIKFWIKLHPGPNNDLVRIYIDGKDVGQCFATWENYYRTSPEQAPPPNVNTPSSINSLQFRSSVPAADLAAGGGYLFDNVTVTTGSGAGPPGCDVPIVKQADARTVRPGGRVGYRITVRNRGRAIARNLLVCDHIPRKMTFVSADRKLRRLGRRRCLVIPRLGRGQRARFHLVLRVTANAPQGTVDNTADITPIGPPGPPLAPLGPDVPGKKARIVAVRKSKAFVKILAKRAPVRRRPRPIVTG